MINQYNDRLRVLGISPEELQDLFEKTSQAHTAFISGSVVEGYGNVESDIDAYVIYPTELPDQMEAEFEFEGRNISFDYVSDRRVDLESWSLPTILDLAQKIETCAADHWRQCLVVSENDLAFAHRILNGIPCIKSENFCELQSLFSAQQVSKLLAARYMLDYNDVAEDVAGALGSLQYGPLLILAREAVRLALDAFLASTGETNAKGKWRFQKLEKHGDPELLQHYWNVELGTGIQSIEDIPAFAEESLVFANKLIYQAMTNIR